MIILNVYIGFGKEMCDKMVGCKMVIHIKELPNNKIASQFIVEKFPELNCTTLTTEGVVNLVDAPIYGGKASLTYKRTDKGYQSVVESQTTGKWEYDEEYCDAGIKVVSGS